MSVCLNISTFEIDPPPFEQPFEQGAPYRTTIRRRKQHRSLPPQREEAHHHAPILSTFDKSRSKPNPHQPQGMPQKNKPNFFLAATTTTTATVYSLLSSPRLYNTRTVPCQQQPHCHRYPRTTIEIRPDHKDTYRTRITARGDRSIQPRTVIEPRTVPQADPEDPADRFTRIRPAGQYYWNHPGFLPPHP